MENNISTIRKVWEDKRDVLLFALIFFLCLILYYPSRHFGFILDDFTVIAENPTLRHFDLGAILQFDPARFITNLSFTINYIIGTFRFLDWHLVNVALHVLNALMIIKFLEEVSKTPLGSKTELSNETFLFSALAAMLVCFHPVNTQAVNYLVQRATLLCSFFIFSSLFYYAKARNENNNFRCLTLAVLFMGLGMLSKPLMIVFPALLVLYEIAFFGLQQRKEENHVWIFWAMVLLPLIVLPVFLMGGAHIEQLMVSGLVEVDFTERLMTQPRIILSYLRLLIVPVNLIFDYDYTKVMDVWNMRFLFPVLFIATALIVAVKFFTRWRLAGFGFIWFLLTLLPVVFFPLPDLIFEHWLYLPSFGIMLTVTDIMFQLLKTKRVRYGFISFWLICFAVLTFQRNTVWSTPLNLMRDNALKSPKDHRVHLNLGYHLLTEGFVMEAKSEFLETIRLNPTDENGYLNLARLHIEIGQHEEARPLLVQALIYNPRSFKALFNLAEVQVEIGQLEDAFNLYNQTLKINPDLSAAHIGLGNIHQTVGNFVEAKKAYQKAIWLKPESPLGHYNLGNVLFQEKNFYEALGKYQKATQLKPDMVQAHINMGNIYYYFKDHKNAVSKYREALKYDDSVPEAYYNLANALHELELFEEAEAAIKNALKYYRFQGQTEMADEIEKRINSRENG